MCCGRVSQLALGPAAASNDTDVAAVMRQWVDGFNAGDSPSAVATCATQASLIDDFAPHQWQGTDACARWFSDFRAMARTEGIAHATIKLAQPSHSETSAKFAYVVPPVTLSFERKGKPVTDKGILTVTLSKGTAGWRITGWAWADQ